LERAPIFFVTTRQNERFADLSRKESAAHFDETGRHMGRHAGHGRLV